MSLSECQNRKIHKGRSNQSFAEYVTSTQIGHSGRVSAKLVDESDETRLHDDLRGKRR